MEFLTEPGNYVNALTLGSIYAMIAVGYTMVYGIIKLINFAHGEVFMFGAYFGLFVVMAIGGEGGFPIWTIPLATAVAMIGCAGLGVVLDWSAYLPLRQVHRLPDILSTVGLILAGVLSIAYFTNSDGGNEPATISIVLLSLTALAILIAAGATLFGSFGSPEKTFQSSRLSALITAIGMSLALQTIAQLIWLPKPRAIPHKAIPAFFNEPLFHLGANTMVLGKEVVIWIIALVLMIALNVLVQRTKIGKAMRACALDKDTASLMGVNVNHVITFTFVVGSAMAAVAGIFMHLKGGVNIEPRYGYYPGVIAFAAAVLGGIGNIRGATLGGLILGAVKAFGDGTGLAHYSFAFSFGLMCVVIIFRPQGLLGRPEAKRA